MGLEKVKDNLENSVEVVDEYNVHSNPKYLKEERKNDLFIDSTYDYFVFFVPIAIVLVALLNRMFYCLFKY